AASAQIEAQDVRWQLVTRQQQESGKPTDITQLDLTAGKLKGRLMARIRLFDKGQDSEGILLRYALTDKIAPGDEASFSPLLAVPFAIDERRIPRMKGNQFLEIPLDVTS